MKPFCISILFSILTLAGGGAYWVASNLAAWGSGPTDDAAIFLYLVVPILLHALLVLRHGFRASVPGTLLYAATVTGLCFARHHEVAGYPGYDAVRVESSLTSLAGCLILFAVGLGIGFFVDEPARR